MSSQPEMDNLGSVLKIEKGKVIFFNYVPFARPVCHVCHFMGRIIFLWLIFFMLFPPVIGADYYKYVDENGNILFTDDLGKIPEAERHKAQKYKNRSPTPNQPQYPAAPDDEEEKKKFMEILKEQYGAKESCPDETEGQIEEAIRSTWFAICKLLAAGKVEEALNYFGIFTRDGFRRLLSSYKKGKLPPIFTGVNDIKIIRYMRIVGLPVES